MIRKGLLLCISIMCVGGCSHMSNTDKGVLGGAGLGAGAGAIIGSATGNAGAGAAIGGILGGVTGGLVGSGIDQAEHRAHEKAVHDIQVQQAAQKQMSMFEIIDMARQHVGDDLIINQIRTTGSAFNLTSQDIITLRQNGVSNAVIQEMQKARFQPISHPQPVTVAPGPVIHREVIIQRPPPRVHFGIGYFPHRHFPRHHCHY